MFLEPYPRSIRYGYAWALSTVHEEELSDKKNDIIPFGRNSWRTNRHCNKLEKNKTIKQLSAFFYNNKF